MVSVVINSDDLGLNANANEAISLAFAQGLISSTTSLVNFPDAFAEAIDLVHAHKIPKDAIGLHLNLTEGVPLTNAIKQDSFFCLDGKFHEGLRENPAFYLNEKQAENLYGEIAAQIQQFIKGYGFLPSHIDGHHHIHTQWAIGKILFQLAEKYGIKSIRLSRNVGQQSSFSKKLYKFIYNHWLKIHAPHACTYFGDIDDFLFAGMGQNGVYEVMVHALLSGTELVDLDGQNLAIRLNHLLENVPHKKINYRQL